MAKLSSHYLKFMVCFILLSPYPLFSSENLDDALTPRQREILNEIESSILSPFCTGRLLKDCPSSAGNELRRDIKEKILAGTSKEEIIRQIYSKYGEDLQAVPELTGFGSVAWAAPVVFLAIGFLFILHLLKKNTSQGKEL